MKSIEKKRRTDISGVIKFHLISILVFEKNEDLIQSDIDMLVYLIYTGTIELRQFCYEFARYLYPDINPENYAIKEQNIRNRINKLEKRNFIVKSRNHNKLINIDPSLDLDIKEQILYKYSLLAV